MGRYLEVLYTNSKNVKLTLNPSTGRTTLKIPKGSHKNIIGCYVKLGEILKNYITLTPNTYRGRILFNRNTNSYFSILETERKTDKIFISVGGFDNESIV